MSIEGYFEKLGVVHKDVDCPVCPESPSEPHRSLWERFKAKNLDLALIALIMVAVAYHVATLLMYKIVGG